MSRVYLDVSILEAPEPLQQAIAALAALPAGDFLHLHHRLKPCHLYRYLAEQGLVSETRAGEWGDCEVFIWREGDTAAARQAGLAAGEFSAWRDG